MEIKYAITKISTQEKYKTISHVSLLVTLCGSLFWNSLIIENKRFISLIFNIILPYSNSISSEIEGLLVPNIYKNQALPYVFYLKTRYNSENFIISEN